MKSLLTPVHPTKNVLPHASLHSKSAGPEDSPCAALLGCPISGALALLGRGAHAPAFGARRVKSVGRLCGSQLFAWYGTIPRAKGSGAAPLRPTARLLARPS